MEANGTPSNRPRWMLSRMVCPFSTATQENAANRRLVPAGEARNGITHPVGTLALPGHAHDWALDKGVRGFDFVDRGG